MSVNGQPAAASWIGTRYFAVDYDAGDDTALGYDDTSMSAAGLVAIKTLEHLRSIVPRFGNGQRLVIACKARAGGATYRNIANTLDDDLVLDHFVGYQLCLVRGTATVPSAGSVAFANDSADRIAAGCKIATGTNVAGYNPAGVPTTSVFDCVLAGGGAPGLLAEPGLIGKRVRFDVATTTVALRNVCAYISANDTDTITVGPNLPAVPVASDVFYIEAPGFAVGRVKNASDTVDARGLDTPFSAGTTGVAFIGVAAKDTTSTRGILCEATASRFAFCECENASATAVGSAEGGSWIIGGAYITEDGVAVNVGVGMRSVGGINVSRCFGFTGSEFACVGAGATVFLGTMSAASVGNNWYTSAWNLSIIISATVGVGGAVSRPGRVVAPVGVPGMRFQAVQRVQLNGLDITGAGGNSLMRLEQGGPSQMTIIGVTGSAGNTGIGLDMSSITPFGANVAMGTTNTFTGAAGRDIEMSGPVRYTHADYARTDLKDAAGNSVQLSGFFQVMIGSTTIATNDGAADIGQYKICRTTATGVVAAAKADLPATSAGVSGVCQSPFTAAGPQKSMLMNGGGTWLQFDGAPAAGAIAYLSDVTAGNARDTPPPFAATNQKLRLGRVMRVSGTLGFVAWAPETLPVLSDGLP